MTQVVVDHGGSGCFGTRLAPAPRAIHQITPRLVVRIVLHPTRRVHSPGVRATLP